MDQSTDLVFAESFALGDGKAHTKSFSKTQFACEIEIECLITLFYFRFPKNFVFSGERHNFWELIYLDKGELFVTLDEQEYCLKAGEIIFIRPNKFHNIRANGVESQNYIIITFVCKSPIMSFFKDKILKLSDFEKKLLSNLIAEASNTFHYIETAPPVTQEYFKLTIKESAPFGAMQMLKCYLEQLMISLCRKNNSILTDTRNLTSKRQQIYSQTTLQIISVLEKNMSKRLNISEIAQMLNLSVPQVKSAFHNEIGQGIIRYFSDMKIKEAKRLITQGDLNFTQISQNLGFESIHYFSRVFKAKTGMTPTEYSLSIYHG